MKQLLTLLVFSQALIACSAYSPVNVRIDGDFRWTGPAEFHFSAPYDANGILASQDYSSAKHEAKRIEWLEKRLNNEPTCAKGYVIDETVIRADNKRERSKHYYGHCVA